MERNHYPVSAKDYRKGDPVLVPRSAYDKGSEEIEVWHFDRMNDDGTVDLRKQGNGEVDGVEQIESLIGNDSRALDEKTQAHYSTVFGESRPGITPEDLKRSSVDVVMADVALGAAGVVSVEAGSGDYDFEVGNSVSFVLFGETVEGHILDIRNNGKALVAYGEGDLAKAINRSVSSLTKLEEHTYSESEIASESPSNESGISERVLLEHKEEELIERLSKLREGLSDSDQIALHMFSASLHSHEEDSARSRMSTALRDDTSRQRQAQDVMKALAAVREKTRSLQ